MNKSHLIRLSFFLLLTMAALLRLTFIKSLPFDSDQAVVGLMAKHITQGEFPILYYGDSYGGILEPMLSSIVFHLFGVSRFNLHLIPFVFSILFIISIFHLGQELFNRQVGLLSLLLAAVPSFSLSLYSSLAYGGYIEILWLGNIVLLMTHRMAVQKTPLSILTLFFLGLLWGIAWWTYPLSITYLISSFFFLVFMKREMILKGKILTTVSGFFLGSIPFWTWNIRTRFAFLSFSRSHEGLNFYLRINSFFYGFINIFNPSLEEELSFIAYLVAAFFTVSLLFLLLKRKWLREKFPSSRGSVLLVLVFLSFCFFYLGSRFSEQKALVFTIRYFLPLYALIPIALGIIFLFLKTIRKVVFIVLFASLLAVNTYHQLSLIYFLNLNANRYQKQLEGQHLLFDFLNQRKIVSAYAPEYWSAAELTFNARENPVFTLPFKDRYPLYTLLADASLNQAFVLEGKYRQSFEEMFRAMGGTYQKEVFDPHKKIKSYVVYYDFKAPKTPCQEILPDLWTAKSNFSSGPEKGAFDRNMATHWTSSIPQKPGMFFQIDLGKVYKINRLVLLCAKGKEWHFPAYYQLELSKNGQDWREVSSVKNNWAYLFWSGGRPFWKLRDGRIETNFKPHDAQFIKITITAPSPFPWTIGELFAYLVVEPAMAETVPVEKIVPFFYQERVGYVYADVGLSAQITLATKGKIKCLQEDYDIARGWDYSMWGYNDPFPYFNKLKKQVDFSLSPAFVVAKENENSFVRTLDSLKATYSVKGFGDQLIYYGLKFPAPAKAIRGTEGFGYFYWTGTHLLSIK